MVSIYENNKHYFINIENDMRIDKYDNCKKFFEGLAGVSHEEKWGFIDSDGNEVIPCEYDEVGVFNQGICKVRKNNYWMIIDKMAQNKQLSI